MIAGPRRTLLWMLMASLGVAGCQHGEAVSSGESPRNNEPFAAGEPLRLTYSAGENLAPSWHPDGTTLLYSFWEPSRTQNDRCIGVLPVTGGQVSRHRCPTNDPLGDSLDLFVEPSVGPDGRIAWIEQHSVLAHETPDRGALVVGDLNPVSPTTRLVTLPFVSATGAISMTATHIRWLSRTRITYVATDLIIRAICFGCKMDTVAIGREIMLLDLESGAAPSVVEGTEWATSVWPTADSSGIYFTLGGDSRVWQRSLAGGAATMVHDFQNGQIVRDVSVVGDRLAAIVGGNVNYGFERATGIRQVDSGGVITTLDLVDGSIASHANSRWFRHAILSPDGRSLLAESVQSIARRPELWLFRISD